MSFYPLNLVLTDSSGALLTGGLAETDMNLRVSPYTTRSYTQLAQANGVYTFGSVGTPIVSGEYKLFKTDTEITAFGVLKIGESGFVSLTRNETIAGVKTFSSQAVFSAGDGLKTDLIAENTSGVGVTIDGILLKDSLAVSNIATASDLDALETLCTDFANRAAGTNQNIARQWTFTTTPYITDTMSSPFEIPNIKWVTDRINNYLSGAVSTEQQTETKFIVDYNGTYEVNKRYTNIDAALTGANAIADSTTRCQIYIDGNGNDDGSLVANYNLLTTTYDDYVDIVGIAQSVIVRINDDNYSATTLGLKVIENCTIQSVSAATPNFDKFIFRNVKFSSTGATAGYTLTDCILENCVSELSTFTLTTCKGKLTDITNSKDIILQDAYDKTNVYQTVYANGDLRGKRVLGRQGSDIASASSITLGEGNYFIITGTTTIATISTTNWTDGSIVNLYFNSTVTLDTGGGNLVRVGGNITTTGGQVVTLLMDASSWIIINS